MDTTWFGVVPDIVPLPVLRDYGRFADIVATTRSMNLDDPSSPLQGLDEFSGITYPSLTSFVGQTGAGKSTIIKLLIELRHSGQDPLHSPVVGEAGSFSPTSGDVHLYLAPGSSTSRLCFYADCEGLDAGDREPAATATERYKQMKARIVQKRRGQAPRKGYVSERELVWARSKGRGHIVSHLYPRVLYTFSDVIVFVHQNEK